MNYVRAARVFAQSDLVHDDVDDLSWRYGIHSKMVLFATTGIYVHLFIRFEF